MKLAICSVGELFGGVERHILGMCTWLQRQGHTPLLILFHDADLAHQARSLNVETIILSSHGSLDFTCPRRVAAILADHEIEVVHAHGYRSVVNCALAQIHYRFTMVRTVHGLVEPCDGWSFVWLKGKFYTWLERFWSRRVGAFVTYVTEDLRQKHERIDHGTKTMAILNGIDPLDAKNYPRPPEFENGCFQIVAVGRVTEVKGLSYALDAIAGLPTDSAVQLNIIGNGPSEQSLKMKVVEQGIEGRVRFLGFRKNVYDFMVHADVLLMPSLHEGAPYTILEAMSFGLPIVASKIGGLPELLENEKSGLLVEVGDVKGLIVALTELMANSEKRQSLGRNGRIRQVHHFNLDLMGEAFWKLYCELVDSGED